MGCVNFEHVPFFYPPKSEPNEGYKTPLKPLRDSNQCGIETFMGFKPMKDSTLVSTEPNERSNPLRPSGNPEPCEGSKLP